MKGREDDLWQREVQAKPAGKLVAALAAKGFGGIYIDRQGYADRGAELEQKLEALLGAPPLRSGDDRLSFFALGAARR